MDPATMAMIASAGAGIFGSLFGNKGGRGKTKQLKTMAPYQEKWLSGQFEPGAGIESNQLYGAGSSFLQNLLSGNPEAFAAFEAPYMQNFQQKVVPGIAERFAGMGTGGGASSSSALYNSLAEAGKNLQVDLAGLRSGLQMQAAQQALPYAQQPYANKMNLLSQRPFENMYINPQGGGGMGQGIGSMLPYALMALSQMGGRGGGNYGSTVPTPVPGGGAVGSAWNY